MKAKICPPFRRRIEASDVLRTFLDSHGFVDDIGRFLEARQTETVTEVCDEIMDHVSGAHKGSMMQYLFSTESESDLMESVGTEVVEWVGGAVSGQRRLEEEQSWNVTRRMADDTWYQSLGYVVAGNALIKDSRLGAGVEGLMSSFGTPAERVAGCATFVNTVNDQVQMQTPEGIQYHPEDEIVSIDEGLALTLKIKSLLPAVTLASGQIVLALFHSCRRFANEFGKATCVA